MKLNNINTYLLGLLVIVTAIGLFFTLSVPKPATPETREITLTILGADCADCFDLTQAVESFTKQPLLDITRQNLTIAESASLASKYNISKLPAVVITGNIANFTVPSFETFNDALVFSQTPAPYYDIASKKVKGNVIVTQLIDANCKECVNMSVIIDQLEQAGVHFTERKTLSAHSDEGKQLIELYKIEKIPTLLFTADATEYSVINDVWKDVGTTEADGTMVLRYVSPPYLNVTSGDIVGKVTLSIITDNTCKDCFNASTYELILGDAFSIPFATVETHDVTSTRGKYFVNRYHIDAVPAAVLSADASLYQGMQGWNLVGTQEGDGSYVFRDINKLGPLLQQLGTTTYYKNLTSGQVVNITIETQ